MNRNALQWLGFALPTVAVITQAHLREQLSWGEGLDGVVSGLFFTLPFAVTNALRSRFFTTRAASNPRTPGQELRLGLWVGALAWALIWLGWSIPATQPLREHAFAINCAATALAGLLVPGSGRRSDAHGTAGALTVG
jgi:hypothetical protein